MSQINEEVEKIFNAICFQCDPKNKIGNLVEMLVNGRLTSNFSGGCGDFRTKHENMFALLCPSLKPQVTFGTGKGGHKKYLAKKFTVDFLSEDGKTAYEIDGSNHKGELQSIKDRVKELFLWNEHGIETVRLTNERVERLVKVRIAELIAEGVIKC